MPQELIQKPEPEQEQEQGLILIENKTIVEAFSEDGGLDSIIDQARQKVAGFVHDLSTDAGRKKSASIAHKVSKLKVRLDNMGKDLTAESEKKIKVIRGSRKAMRDALDEIRDEVRKPLTDWQAAEERRGQEHRSNIAYIRSLALIIHPETGGKMPLVEMEENLVELQHGLKIGDAFEEFKAEAEGAKEASMFALSTAIKETKEQLAKDAELKRLQEAEVKRAKKEYEDNIKRIAAETARVLAEENAEKLRIEAAKVAADKAEKIETDKQAALDLAKKSKEEAAESERQRVAAENQAKIDADKAEADIIAEKEKSITDAKNAEDARILAEKKAKQDIIDATARAKQGEIARQKQEVADEKIIQEKLEKDKRHIGKIRKAAKESLIVYLEIDEALAKKIVMAVHDGEIENIFIKY